MNTREILICSDLHLPPQGQLARDVDVWKRWERLKAGMKRYASRADTLFILGDLCFDNGQEAIYRAIRDSMQEWDVALRCIPGNHDDSTMLAQSFGLEQFLRPTGELYWQEDHGERGVWIFMDTAAGRASSEQLDWLRSLIAALQDRRLMIFIHHPPTLASVPHMDNNYGLENRKELMRILDSHNLPAQIFCGHYHVQKTVQASGHSIFICPSPFFTIDDTQQEFQPIEFPLAFMRVAFTGDRIEVNRHVASHIGQ